MLNFFCDTIKSRTIKYKEKKVKKHKCFYFQKLVKIFKNSRWTRLRAEAEGCSGCRERLNEWEVFLRKWKLCKKKVVGAII